MVMKEMMKDKNEENVSTMIHFRSASYSPEEDIHICEVYSEVTQDPIIGNNQSGNTLWSRIETNYNSTIPTTKQRNAKSLKDRFTLIKSAVRSLNGCIAQIELLNPSGASNDDIMHRAKIMLMTDPKYPKGFKFDHVFKLIKDIVDVGNNTQRRNNNVVSQLSDGSVPDSPDFPSPGVTFNVNLSDDTDGVSPSRPGGVKKAKQKRKSGEETSRAAKVVEESNKRIGDIMAESNLQQIRVANEFSRISQQRRDDKIMDKDLDTIRDPARREWYRNEQLKIMQKSNQTQFGSESDSLQQYFGDIGGSGRSDLGDY